jgi:hypothetical protein
MDTQKNGYFSLAAANLILRRFFFSSFFRINQSIRKYRYLFPIKCIKDTNDIELQLLSICLYIHPTYQNSHIENTEITTTTFPVLHNPKNKRKNEYRKKTKNSDR